MLKYSILSCRVFEGEIAKFPPRNPPLQIEFFDISLHLNPDAMHDQITAQIGRFSNENEYILLMFGLCGNAALGISSDKFKLVIPRMHECVAMFLNSVEKYETFRRNETSTYFATPGWAAGRVLPGEELERAMLEKYEEKFPCDPILVEELMDSFREQYKTYNKYLYVDFIGDSDSERYCQNCAKYLKWNFEKIKNPETEFFTDAINQNWRDKRKFLTVPLGKTIRRVYDERIFDAE